MLGRNPVPGFVACLGGLPYFSKPTLPTVASVCPVGAKTAFPRFPVAEQDLLLQGSSLANCRVAGTDFRTWLAAHSLLRPPWSTSRPR